LRRTAAVLLLVVLAAATAGACAGRSSERELHLDGRPRIPDDEGVATSLSADEITLDGKRTYEVSDELRSFSTYTLALEPMLGRKGQYVQVGLDGDTVVWMAGIAQVLDVRGDPSVYYTGRFARTIDGRFAFVDGTTFAPTKGLRAPARQRDVTVRIDARRHEAVEIT
jgi:hypothetical protein